MYDEAQMISVCAPVYNEAEGIEAYIDETIAVLQSNFPSYEIILVDDGSRDATVDIVKAKMRSVPQLRLLRLSRNFGREIAMSAGLDAAKGHYTVIMDSDLQDPPHLIPQLYKKAQEGYDIVYAARASREGETWLKKKTSQMFYKLTAKLTGYAIPDDAGDFRIFSRHALDALLELREHNRYMKMLYAYIGFSTASVTFSRPPRPYGTTKYNWVSLIGAAVDAIVSFSDKPLRYVSLGSLLVSGILMVGIAVTLLGSLFSHGSGGAPWLALLTCLLFSFLFGFMAVLTEYIGRMLVETKQRPLYFLRHD